MAILLVVSIAAGTVIILRSAALRERSILPPALAEEIERLQPGDDLDKLERLISRHPSALARVLNTLLQHLTWSRAEAVEAVQTRARHEVSRLESGLVILEITTGIAPLLGLLGTLSGLVGFYGRWHRPLPSRAGLHRRSTPPSSALPLPCRASSRLTIFSAASR